MKIQPSKLAMTQTKAIELTNDVEIQSGVIYRAWNYNAMISRLGSLQFKKAFYHITNSRCVFRVLGIKKAANKN